MITGLSHATIYVLDHDRAKDFYTNKLGFEVRMDHTMDNGFRWLTVGPKEQKDIELILMLVQPGGMFDADVASKLQSLIEAGKMGAGVLATDDCHATYATLKDRGVEFISEPVERFYGIEAMFKDDSGNWYSLTQRK